MLDCTLIAAVEFVEIFSWLLVYETTPVQDIRG